MVSKFLKVTAERLLLTAVLSTFTPNGVEMSATRGVFGLDYVYFLFLFFKTETHSDQFTVTVSEK